jgi:hypothetical protein
MWLIDTNTLQLKHVINPEKGSYVILSHTWGNDEVSFQEFADLDFARRKAGFAKIEKTCQLAKSRSIRYAWVDTCCIDKTSSAELSEAINSMFRWYQNADVCLAFLFDLAHREWGATPILLTLEILEQCRWFRRGWTLQELIAPLNVEFYDASWDQIGNKESTSLVAILSKITGIQHFALTMPTFFRIVPVGTRMRWAANRETTRPEDMAYCLLGLFDINMPLLYGEGEKAFIRLQEEICKQTDDMSLFAWTIDPDALLYPKGRGIFASHPSEFSRLPELLVVVDENDKEFTITNKGVTLTNIELLRSKHQELILPLNVITSDKRHVLGIYVTRSSKGYIRIKPKQLAIVQPFEFEDIPPRPIYFVKHDWFKEQPSYLHHFEFKAPWKIELIQATPPRLFDYEENAFLFDDGNWPGYNYGCLHLRVKGIYLLIISSLKDEIGRPPKYDISYEGHGALSNENWGDFRTGLDKLWRRRKIQHKIDEYISSHDIFDSSNEVTISLAESDVLVTLKRSICPDNSSSKLHHLSVTFHERKEQLNKSYISTHSVSKQSKI